jgi:RNA polymerase sigma-70 factor (ECF subfamily)
MTSTGLNRGANGRTARQFVVRRAPTLRVHSGGSMAAPTSLPTATRLLAHVAAGDLGAVRLVIERYGDLIWSIARRFERQEAEDAVQEIFLDLWKSAHRYDPAVATEPTFIVMLARRRLVDRRRRRDRRLPSQQTDHFPIVADSAPGPDIAAEAGLAARAIDGLQADQRLVVLLSVCHGLTHSEIAEQTKMPLGTVKTHARRGLLAIRAALGERTEES